MNAGLWSRAPIVRLILPFAAGILVCNYYSAINAGYYLLASSLFLLLFLFFLHSKLFTGFIKTIFIFLCSFFAGMAVCQDNKLDLKPDFFGKHLRDSSLLLVRIYEPLQEKENSYKAIAEVEAVINDEISPAIGRVILYLKKENLTRLPNYGEKIIISNTVKSIQKPQNPQVFDYSAFMRYKRIYHSAYLQNYQFAFTGQTDPNFVREKMYSVKRKLLASLDYYVEGKEERGIAKALIIGDETEVLPHVTASYAGTGTLHILSVSGLHVGFIFIGLNFLLSGLNFSRTGRFLRAAILIISLATYAILTGLSPSVMRSVIMFSLVVIGINFRKIHNIYNTMAFSALGLLIIDPFLLLQLGFQLSYIALLGIVWLHPHISKFWQPENKYLVKMRDILAISLAAQIATFPLGLYYFNQFPTYFLFSNLLVIPWSSLALTAGFGFLILSLLPIPELITILAGKILYYIIYGLNKTVDFLATLPFAQWEGTFLNTLECLVLYIAIILLLFALLHQHKKLLYLGLGIFILFFTVRIIAELYALRENKLIVHAVPKTAVLSINEQNNLYLIGDSAFTNNPDQRKFYIQRYAFSEFVPKPYIISPKNALTFQTRNFYFQSPFGIAGNSKFLWLTNKTFLPEKISEDFDFLILSKNVKISIEELKEKINFRQVILTADNSFYRNNNWEKECSAMGISCINLQKDKSFELNY